MIDVSAGVPGVNAPEPTSFEEFWPFYVSQHLHPSTRRCHALGVGLGLTSLALAVVTGTLWMALGLPLFAYGFAVPAHYVWEKNRPALLGGRRAFVWAIGSDARQFVRFCTGRLEGDVQAVRAGLGLAPYQVTLADAAVRQPA